MDTLGKLAESLLRAPQRLLHVLARRDVAHETARVDELSVAPEHIRIQQHGLDRAIGQAQADLVILETLVGGQARENFLRIPGVRQEFLELPAHAFLAPAAEQIRQRTVGPKDGSILGQPLQAHGGGLHEIRQLRLLLAQDGRA